jgi:TM2 domain-containing membrane protein YozV
MKLKIFLTGFALLMLSLSPVYASFPVQKEVSSISNNANVTFEKQKQETFVPAAGGSKSQLVALLLCLFVGGFGIHRFYLGYPLIGVLQILTLGGLGIWTLIDLIMIITGSLQPKDSSYDTTL